MDLAGFLVLMVAVSGVLWLVDLFVNEPKRKEMRARLSENALPADREAAEFMPLWADLARSFLPVFLVVLLLRSFLVEPFRIPSGSMMPTLLVGDFILVNKYSYGLRLPILNTKFLSIGEPERGDVVVFRYPEDPSVPFIKRVVGVPGDEVVYHHLNKTLYINGELVPQQYLKIYQGEGASSSMTGAERLEEVLPPDVKHDILVRRNQLMHPGLVNQPLYRITVPEGQYFVLGDNRDNSKDSRFWGTVPEENLIGKAFMIWMSWDGGLNWERIGNSIQ